MRRLRFFIFLTVALVLVPFFPLYIERTMMRSWRMDHQGDLITWGWKVCTLSTFWSDYRYIRPEQQPAIWLTLNLALAFIYAIVIAVVIDRLLVRRNQSTER